MTKHYITLTLLSVLCAAGCGQRLPDGIPPIYPCQITLTQEGQALAGATVIFVPEAKCLWSVVGMSDSSGKTKMMTNGLYDGAPAGKYKVTVTHINGTEMVKNGYYTTTDVDVQYGYETTTSLEMEVTQTKNQNKRTFDLGKPVNVRVGPLQWNEKDGL